MSVLYSVTGGVATITLNRPESRNALNLDMCEGILGFSRECSSNPEVKLVFVRANGPVFCAGADLKERQGMSEAQVRERRAPVDGATWAHPSGVNDSKAVRGAKPKED